MEDYKVKYDIESVVAKISNEYCAELKISNFSLVETRKFEDIYIQSRIFSAKARLPS